MFVDHLTKDFFTGSFKRHQGKWGLVEAQEPACKYEKCNKNQKS